MSTRAKESLAAADQAASSRNEAQDPDALLYPWTAIRAATGSPPPTSEPVAVVDLPEPQRSLLDHQESMTKLLELHCGQPIRLMTKVSLTVGPRFIRWSVLAVPDGRASALGCLSVDVNRFSDTVRQEIIRSAVPLGHLLRHTWHEYVSVPRYFFAVDSDEELDTVFRLTERNRLFGRRTELRHRGDRVVDIIELLPPVLPVGPSDIAATHLHARD